MSIAFFSESPCHKKSSNDLGGVTVFKWTRKDGKRDWTKPASCNFCDHMTTSSNITKHMLTKHRREIEIQEILSLPMKSKERKNKLEYLRNKANFKHNNAVLSVGKGTLIPWRCPTDSGPVDPKDYIPCEFCLGFFLRKELWRHQQKCSLRKDCKRGRRVISRSELLLSPAENCSNGLKENVLAGLANDSVSEAVKKDSLILAYGERLYQKNGHRRHKWNGIRQKLRQMARLVIHVQSINTSLRYLASLFDTTQFPTVISAVRALCGYSSESNKFQEPIPCFEIRPWSEEVCHYPPE